MQIEVSQIPHRYRNRFMRDNSGGSLTINQSSSQTISTNSNSTSKSFLPVNLWGNYFDDTEDINGSIDITGNVTASGSITAMSADVSTLNSSVINAQTGRFDVSVSAPTVSGTTANFVYTNASTVNSSTANVSTGNFCNVNSDSANITALESQTVDASTLTVHDMSAVTAYIQSLLSDNITTDYLTVTKQAHFFSLIIDELKAVGGQVILSPARAKIDLVEQQQDGSYLCYIMAKDSDGRQIHNNFIVDDQAICQTFNVASGTNYNVSNKYYWRLVTAVSSSTVIKSINGSDVECHYIVLSDTDKDGSSVPAAGDEIVQLGYRGTDDAARQSAIILSAYQSIDTEITAPSYAQYKGINDYHLSTHRYTYFAANDNEIRGNLKVSTGQTVESLINSIEQNRTYVHTAYSNSASDWSQTYDKVYDYIGFCSNLTESDSALTYSDYTWSRLKGVDGSSGLSSETYALSALVEKALVDKNGTLSVQLQYNIMHIVGTTSEIVTATSDGYRLMFTTDTARYTYYQLSLSATPTYTNNQFMTDYHSASSKPNYLYVYLVEGSNATVVLRRVIPIMFAAGSVFEITDDAITSAVQSSKSYTDGEIIDVSNYISTVKQTAESISGRVQTIENDYVTTGELTLTSNQLKSTITAEYTEAFRSESETVIDLTDSTYNSDYYYPVSISLVMRAEPYRIIVERSLDSTYGVPSYSTHTNGFTLLVDWTTITCGWGTYWSYDGSKTGANWAPEELNDSDGHDTYRYINKYTYTWTNTDKIAGSIRQNAMTKSMTYTDANITVSNTYNDEIIYLRGGSKYDVKTNCKYAIVNSWCNGYNWQSDSYTKSCSVITNSANLITPAIDAMHRSEIIQTADVITARVQTIENDYVTSSQLTQTADNIKLALDSSLGQTGINLETGKITLDAQNTTITGNLSITGTVNAFTFADDAGNDVLTIGNVEIDSKNDFTGTNLTKYTSFGAAPGTYGADGDAMVSIGVHQPGNITIKIKSVTGRVIRPYDDSPIDTISPNCQYQLRWLLMTKEVDGVVTMYTSVAESDIVTTGFLEGNATATFPDFTATVTENREYFVGVSWRCSNATIEDGTYHKISVCYLYQSGDFVAHTQLAKNGFGFAYSQNSYVYSNVSETEIASGDYTFRVDSNGVHAMHYVQFDDDDETVMITKKGKYIISDANITHCSIYFSTDILVPGDTIDIYNCRNNNTIQLLNYYRYRIRYYNCRTEFDNRFTSIGSWVDTTDPQPLIIRGNARLELLFDGSGFIATEYTLSSILARE